MRSVLRVGVLVCVAALALGACGGSDSKDASGTNSNPAAQSKDKSDDGGGGGGKLASDAACKFITQAEATELFAESKAAKALFGAEFVEHYAMTRRWESEVYRRAVTDWELARYFERI